MQVSDIIVLNADVIANRSTVVKNLWNSVLLRVKVLKNPLIIIIIFVVSQCTKVQARKTCFCLWFCKTCHWGSIGTAVVMQEQAIAALTMYYSKNRLQVLCNVHNLSN